MRKQLEEKVSEKEREIIDKSIRMEIEKQRAVNEETKRARLHEQKELEAASIRQIEQEEK